MLGYVGGREARVREDDIATRGSVSVLRAVHPTGAGVDEFRKVKRHEIVDRRCPYARALRRVHPVGEVEDVERAHHALERETTRLAPGDPPRLGAAGA